MEDGTQIVLNDGDEIVVGHSKFVARISNGTGVLERTADNTPTPPVPDIAIGRFSNTYRRLLSGTMIVTESIVGHDAMWAFLNEDDISKVELSEDLYNHINKNFTQSFISQRPSGLFYFMFAPKQIFELKIR